MAYSSEMKKINFALSPDDLDRFNGVKAFTGKTTDADVIRFCIREAYLNLCKDDSRVEYIENAVQMINDLRIELLALVRE